MMNQNEIEVRKQELTNEAVEQVVGGGKVRQAEGKTVYTVGLGDTLRNITDMHQNS